MEFYSDDAFYENLTLGLLKILGDFFSVFTVLLLVNKRKDDFTRNFAENTPGIRDVNLEKIPPCDRLQISTWEQRHSCILPIDMKQFYLSTDGFRLSWSYEYAGEVHTVGHMKINGISELKRIGGVKPQGDSDSPSLLDIETCNPKSDPNRPHFCMRCKIFEIDSCQGDGRVCLVYLDKYDADMERREKPKIWLLDRSLEWHFLADSFTQYFRMMLVHQGLPQWQFRFTSMGLTQFAEEIMLQVAPHLLQNTPTSFVADWPTADNGPLNQLDPSVFRNVREKCGKKKESKTENPT